MSTTYQFTKNNACAHHIHLEIDESDLFSPHTIEWVRIDNGSQVLLSMSDTLNAEQYTALQSLIEAQECNHQDIVSDEGDYIVDDTQSADPNVVWSSDKITQIIENSTGSNVFGAHAHFVESANESSTTSSSYQRKIRLTTSDLPTGIYHIAWSYEWANASGYAFSRFRVDLNDSGSGAGLLHEIDTMHNVDSNSWFINTGFTQISLTGINTIDLDYRRVTGWSASTQIRRARLQLWRIL